MDVARLNFSHGDPDFHRATIARIRSCSQKMGKPVAILQDLQGPKIRTGRLQQGGAVELVTGQRLIITTAPITGNRERISTSYAGFPADVKSGDRVRISDGSIELKVISTSATEVSCEVLLGGKLVEHQGINLPGVLISAPALTPKDLADLDLGLQEGVDYIALSFVRTAADVLQLKDFLAERGCAIPVIAKLEKPRAIQHLTDILEACEGVMVARGDLGVEMAPEKVPIIQKQVIQQANQRGKVVITATQMLESMIHNPSPTRAEASDVANAVFDGSDALMLSAETARGDYPVKSLTMMDRIIRESEGIEGWGRLQLPQPEHSLSFPEAVCDAAYHASQAIKARAIVAFTQTGSTACLISKYRPETQILGLTPHPEILRRLALYWGVEPVQLAEIDNVDELLQEMEGLLLRRGMVESGDALIVLTGAPIVEKGHTSLMKLHSVR